jgi:hypothetical protein
LEPIDVLMAMITMAAAHGDMPGRRRAAKEDQEGQGDHRRGPDALDVDGHRRRANGHRTPAREREGKAGEHAPQRMPAKDTVTVVQVPLASLGQSSEFHPLRGDFRRSEAGPTPGRAMPR